MGNSSKEGVGIVLVTREALNNFGSFFLIDDDVTVCYPLESLLKILGNPFFTGDNAKVPLPLGKSLININNPLG